MKKKHERKLPGGRDLFGLNIKIDQKLNRDPNQAIVSEKLMKANELLSKLSLND